MYSNITDLIEKVESLVHRHPDKLTVETLKSGTEGYNANVTVVTYGQSGKQSDDRSKIRILLCSGILDTQFLVFQDFGQHLRELITSELALRIVSILRRGVDLDWNWGVDWGRKEKDYDPAEEYPGTAPFSEPETKIIRDIATSFNPHIWVNVHSGTEGLRMKALTEELNKVHCHGHCKIGSDGKSVWYLAHGTAPDYMYEAVRVPMSFNFEIYAGDKTSSEDCFKSSIQ
ncbi:pentatricopeptide repeat-containing protein [Hibiscus syriacus]|uniref:Pentatricopeptide repeat-containing protein n=1 Tax=Hibiscus syriacus TaxID=106335 RepID=A0A6A3BEX1_HIBSY|nr:pentatricopeptide repeat-containing protein [Hibiscus syriacus]